MGLFPVFILVSSEYIIVFFIFLWIKSHSLSKSCLSLFAGQGRAKLKGGSGAGFLQVMEILESHGM